MSALAVTKHIFLDIKPDTSFDKYVKSLYEEASKLEGIQDVFWGYNVEDPSKVELQLLTKLILAGSASRSAKISFLSQISTTPPRIQLLAFKPEAIILAPITELLSFSELLSTFMPSALDPMLGFIRRTPGCLSATVAPVVHDNTSGKSIIVIVGWESVEANEKGAKSEGFKKLPKMEAKVEMHHAKFRRVE